MNVDLEVEGQLLKKLTPLLLEPMDELALESWYTNHQKEWGQYFGSKRVVKLCAELIFEEFMASQDYHKAAVTKMGIGRLHFQDNEMSHALKSFYLALELSNHPTLTAWLLNNIGASYGQSDQNEVGASYLDKTMCLPGIDTMFPVKALCYGNLGIYYGDKGENEQATIFFKEAVALAKKHDLKAIETLAQLNLAYQLIFSGYFNEAIDRLKSIPGAGEIRLNEDNVFLNLYLSEAYKAKKEFDLAEHYLNRSCLIADSLDYALGKLYCSMSWAELYEELEDFPKALAAAKEFFKLDEEQIGIEVTKEIQSLESKLKLKERDLEIQRINKEVHENDLRRKKQFRQFISIVAVLAIIALVIYWLVQTQSRNKLADQRKSIAEAKLELLQSQMSPHFLYNVLGGIQNYILKSEKNEAQKYLGKFTMLLQTVANNSGNIHINLDNEVEFIKTYLALEKLRFREEFEYQLVLDQSLQGGTYYIPSIVIQPIVENAMIHGLAGLDRKGKLDIQICRFQDGIKCVVTDNGRGRAAAAIKNERSGRTKHLSIASTNTNGRLAFLRKIGYENAHLKIEDLYHNQRAAGTRATVYLPFMYVS